MDTHYIAGGIGDTKKRLNSEDVNKVLNKDPNRGRGNPNLMIDNEPWFVLSDVCKVLAVANVGNAKARLNSDDVEYIRNTDVKGIHGNTVIVNESGATAHWHRPSVTKGSQDKRNILRRLNPVDDLQCR